MYKIQEWTKFTLKKTTILHMYVYCILGLMEKIRLRENALGNLADILVADIFR